MGPRSENRGYDGLRELSKLDMRPLQWVHGPRTVVMGDEIGGGPIDFRASMGPRSENRGYVNEARDVVTQATASMGPRSENRGYGSAPLLGIVEQVKPCSARDSRPGRHARGQDRERIAV